jgi:hypothetical protein
MTGAIVEPQSDLRGEGHRVHYGFGPPVAASDMVGVPVNVGDVVINVTPVTGGPERWLCVTAGTAAVPQGVWTAVGGDTRMGFALNNTQLKATNSAPLIIVPAQGAGTLIEVVSLVLENVYLTAAFANGGALALYYGVDATGVLASATVAATFLTSPAANQMIMAAGALATNLSSNVLNKGLAFANPTADFITGAGSLIGKLTYRVHTGL